MRVGLIGFFPTRSELAHLEPVSRT